MIKLLSVMICLAITACGQSTVNKTASVANSGLCARTCAFARWGQQQKTNAIVCWFASDCRFTVKRCWLTRAYVVVPC